MKTVLVTGPSGFLGYHVIKRLNEQGITPRALLPKGENDESITERGLEDLSIEPVLGDVEAPASLSAACEGVDTVLHLNFLISLGGGTGVEKSLDAVNVAGTRNVLDAAAQAGVACVVVSSSALAVGLNRKPQPLGESADWGEHGFHLPYALSRRQAEQEALSRPGGAGLPKVVVVSPSFTMGPEDFVGAPANKLVRVMTKWWFRITLPIGFGVLDVRDFADGVIRAAEMGHHGQRYLLSGDNVMPDQLLKEVAAVRGTKPPRVLFPISAWMIRPLIAALRVFSRVRGKPPRVTASLLELWGRHAWYDTSLARQQLGWTTRPLRETLSETLRWPPADNTSRSDVLQHEKGEIDG